MLTLRKIAKATSSLLGGVKVGSGITLDSDGTISVPTSSGTDIATAGPNVLVRSSLFSRYGKIVNFSAVFDVTETIYNDDIVMTTNCPAPLGGGVILSRGASGGKILGLNIVTGSNGKLAFSQAGSSETDKYYSISLTYIANE